MGGIDRTPRLRINRAAFSRAGLCLLLCSPILTAFLTFYPCNGLAETTAHKDTHSKDYTDLFDYGISGVGSPSIDQASALAAAIAATPDGGEIRCRAGTVMYVSGITIIHRRALHFTTPGYGYANGGQCQVQYIGPAHGMLLDLDSDYDVVFEGWTFWGRSAAYTISINKNRSCSNGGLNSSHNSFKHGGAGGSGVLVGIGISTFGVDCQQNSEFMTFEDWSFAGYKDSNGVRHGTGVQLAHANVKGIVLDRSAIGQLHIWVDNSLNGGGSFKAYHTRGGDTDIYYNGHGNENTIVEGDNFEQGCQILASMGGYWRFSGGRYDAWDSGCGTSRTPSVSITGTSTIEMDYPSSTVDPLYFAGSYAGASTLILHGNWYTNQANMNPAANGITNMGGTVWISGGKILAGSPTYPGFGATNKGYGTWTQYGMPMLGYAVRGNTSYDPGIRPWGNCNDWNNGDACPPRDSLWVGNQHMVFTGMWPISHFSETCAYTGRPGSTTWYVDIFPKDIAGKRGGNYPDGAPGVKCSRAASTLTSSNYLTVTWPRVTGAVGYDVVLSLGKLVTGELISTVSDPGSGTTVSYNITKGSTSDNFTRYAGPTFYESAVTAFYGENVRFNWGVPITCYSDGGSTNAACPLNSSINLVGGKTLQFDGSQIASKNLSDGPFTQVYKASLTTTSEAADNVSIIGITVSSHCSLTATNALAARNLASTYVSAKTRNQITVTHSGTPGMTYDILCTVN